jgi:hypothetical protein
MIRALIVAALLAFIHSALAVDLQNGLIVHLPMRSDLRDHSAKPYPVENSGLVEIRDGAAWFAGKEDWLELPHVPLADRAFAVSMWLKPTGNLPTYGVLEQWDRSTRGHILHLMIRDGLRPWLGFYINDVVSPVSLSNAGEWQHLVYQFTGTTQQIWINGRLICERASEAYHGTSGKTCIGKNPRWNNVPAQDYVGWMSDFRIYDHALAFEEISALSVLRPMPIAAREVAPALALQPAGSVAPAGASAVPLLSIAGGHMKLHGTAGQEYVVETSEDLKKWEPLDTVTVAANGEVEFVDVDAAKFRQRFYRLRYPVP